MPTVIYFTGSGGEKPLTVNVDQGPDEVMAAFNASHGQPFPLQTEGEKIYVQPLTIAYWREPGTFGRASFG